MENKTPRTPDKRSIEEASQMLEKLLALIPRNERKYVQADYRRVGDMLIQLNTFANIYVSTKKAGKLFVKNLYYPALITDLQKAYRAVRAMQRSTPLFYWTLTQYYVDCFHDLFSHYIEIAEEHMQKDVSHDRPQR
jgi:hypothetical protein